MFCAISLSALNYLNWFENCFIALGQPALGRQFTVVCIPI